MILTCDYEFNLYYHSQYKYVVVVVPVVVVYFILSRLPILAKSPKTPCIFLICMEQTKLVFGRRICGNGKIFRAQ